MCIYCSIILVFKFKFIDVSLGLIILFISDMFTNTYCDTISAL